MGDLGESFKIGSLLLSMLAFAFVVFKYISALPNSRKSHLREEYKFCKEFFDEMQNTSNMRTYLKEKGFAALTGGMGLNVNAVEYLLTLPEPTIKIKGYAFTFEKLEFFPENEAAKLQLTQKLRNNSYYYFEVSLYFVGYILSWVCMVLPVFFYGSFASTPKFITILVFSVIIFGYYAWYFLVKAAQTIRAKKFVNELNENAKAFLKDDDPTG